MSKVRFLTLSRDFRFGSIQTHRTPLLRPSTTNFTAERAPLMYLRASARHLLRRSTSCGSGLTPKVRREAERRPPKKTPRLESGRTFLCTSLYSLFWTCQVQSEYFCKLLKGQPLASSAKGGPAAKWSRTGRICLRLVASAQKQKCAGCSKRASGAQELRMGRVSFPFALAGLLLAYESLWA